MTHMVLRPPVTELASIFIVQTIYLNTSLKILVLITTRMKTFSENSLVEKGKKEGLDLSRCLMTTTSFLEVLEKVLAGVLAQVPSAALLLVALEESQNRQAQ